MEISNPAQLCVIWFEMYPLLYSEYSGLRFRRNAFIWRQKPKDCNLNISHYSSLCLSLGFSLVLLRRNWENSGLLLRTFQLHFISQKVTVALVTVYRTFCDNTITLQSYTSTNIITTTLEEVYKSCRKQMKIRTFEVQQNAGYEDKDHHQKRQ